MESVKELKARVAKLEGKLGVEAQRYSELDSRNHRARVRLEELEAAQQPRDMKDAPVREWVYLLVKAKSRSEGNILWLDTNNNFITIRNLGGWLPCTPTPKGGEKARE